MQRNSNGNENSSCQIEREILPSNFFNDVTTLERIDLSNNHIDELSNGLFAKNEQLKWINISHVNLTILFDKQFANFVRLYELILSKNLLFELAADLLNGSYNLKRLDLSDNSLVQLPDDAFKT